MFKLAPPKLFLLFLSVSVPIGFFSRLLSNTPIGFYVIGILLINIGILLNFFGDHEFRSVGTTIKPWEIPSYLVVGGVFKLTRNPMYLGMTLIIISVSFLFSSPFPILIAIGYMYIITNKFIKKEEKNLKDKFGDQFMTYTKKVRRWI